MRLGFLWSRRGWSLASPRDKIPTVDISLLTRLPNVSVDLDVIVVAGSSVLVAVIVYLVLRRSLRMAARLATRSVSHADDIVIASLGGACLLLSCSLGLAVFVAYTDLPQSAERALNIALTGSLTGSVALIATRLLTGVLAVQRRIGPTARSGLALAGRAAIWLVAALTFLAHVGVNISALAASLGIGGIAIAFALQKILADIFSSISIYFDRPFVVGDYIQIGEDDGVVQHIGIKNTRIKTLRGEELVIANSQLVDGRVRNFARLDRRRSQIRFGVTYDTPHRRLAQIPELVAGVFRGVQGASLLRCHFVGFGDSSLDFVVTYHAETDAYDIFLDRQQALLLGIFQALEKARVSMAFPTRTVHLQK